MREQIAGLLGRPALPARPALHEVKLRTIDAAFRVPGSRSVADLGGVWAVEAGYTFYALEHGASRVVLVDDNITLGVRQRAKRFPQVELVERNFGTTEAVAAVGSVDVVLLFDVLLHQVDPDWDEIVRSYAKLARTFAIVNPQYTASDRSIRLLDLGREGYLATVPPQDNHDEVFAHLDETNVRRGRPWRDVHDIWQWGIVDADLSALMSELGFTLVYFESTGPWMGLRAFENHAFVFTRG